MRKLLSTLTGSGTKITLFIVVFIGLLALAVRLWGIEFGFPHVHCGIDEDHAASLAMRYGRGSFKPDSLWWPTLHSYLLFVLYAAYYALGRLFGEFGSLFDFQKLYFTDPQSFYLIGRIFSAVSGALSAVLLFLMAKRVYSRRVGFLAALFLALNFMHIRESQYSRPDILGGVFMALAFMAIVSLKNKKDYLLAGIYTGLAASAKYQFILLIFPALVAHFIPEPSEEKKSWGSRLLHPGPPIMLLAVFIAFFATSPYIVLNLKVMLADVFSAASVQVDLLAKYGFKSSFQYHYQLSFLQGIGLPLMIAAALGILQSLAGPKKADIVLLSFTAIYYLSITLGESVYMRYAMPLLFPLLVFSAKFADSCIGAVDSLSLPKPGKAVFTALLLAALLYLPARKVFSYNSLLAEKDNRVVAAEWIEANIPGGSRLAFAAVWWPEFPTLRESRQSLVDAIQMESRGSVRKVITGYRHKFLLAMPDYPAEPSYYLTQLDEDGRAILGFRGIKADLDTIKAEKIDYIVSIEHYPSATPAISPEFNALIRGHFVLLKELLPYSGSVPPSPLYDGPTGYNLPCDDFERILRPGPIIKIWKTTRAKGNEARPAKVRGAQT